MRKNKKKNLVWILDINTVMEIIELAQKRGKKAGDNMQQEFEEVLKKKNHKFQLLGETDKDSDMLTGDLRERRMKILNIKEIDRKRRRQK